QQRQLKKKSEYFELKEGLLYKKDRRVKGRLLRVLQRYEVDPILFLMHTHLLGGHL
ncbi:17136_t:CDS:1, partial [Cetraspora pellucida]